MDEHQDRILQAICRKYLNSLRDVASRYGLYKFVDETIELNKQGKCKGSEEEAEMLARLCDDERLTRVEVAKVLRKSYRAANDDGDFDKIRKLKHVGIYSKVSTLMNKKKR